MNRDTITKKAGDIRMERIYALADEISAGEIKRIRRKLGLTQLAFACLVNTSKKTVERWETSDQMIKGPIVTLLKLLDENPEIEQAFRIPKCDYPMRLWYLWRDTVCAIIDVDERYQKVKVYNYTSDLINRPFGRVESPTFEQFEEFLESRCFPRTRDKMKLMLKELDLPFYDPLMIIEKTGGRMADDEFSIEIER